MEHGGNVKIRILFRLPKTRLRYAERALRTLRSAVVSPQSTVLPGGAVRLRPLLG